MAYLELGHVRWLASMLMYPELFSDLISGVKSTH